MHAKQIFFHHTEYSFQGLDSLRVTWIRKIEQDTGISGDSWF